MSFTSHMITSLKHNKRSPVSAFEKMKNFKEGINIQVSFDKKSTPHQLKRIREKIQNENRKSFKKKLILFGTIIAFIIFCIGFIKF